MSRVEKFAEKLVDYRSEESKKSDGGSLYPTTTDAQEAIGILCEALLGEDYYIVDPLPNCQCNTLIVDEILYKYCRKYRKLVKKYNKIRRIIERHER